MLEAIHRNHPVAQIAINQGREHEFGFFAQVPRIFQQMKQLSSLDFNRVVEVLKKEKIAITLLFFSALGLLPAWIAITFAVCGTVRLIWSLYQSNCKISEICRTRDQAGKLLVENHDLQRLYNNAVQERERTENDRDLLHQNNGLLQIEKNKISDELAEAVEQMREMRQQYDANRRDLELQIGARDANAQINQALTWERDSLNTALKIRETQKNAMVDERNEALKMRDAAIQEKDNIQRELESAHARELANPLLKQWVGIEKERNDQLARINEAYQQWIKDRKEEDLSGLEMIVDQVIPGLQAQKEICIAWVTEAIENLPAGHASKTSLAAIREVFDKEKSSLSDIAKTFSLPISLRRVLHAKIV